MRRHVTELTERAAVLAAIAECDSLGRESFRRKYGFGPSTGYILRHEDLDYDSKAIAAVAFGIQHKTTPLIATGGNEIHGGIKPREAGGVLIALGYVIVGRDGQVVKLK
jgi:hypothetical protein